MNEIKNIEKTNEKLNEILLLLSDVNKKIDDLQCDVLVIKKQLTSIENNCSRMDRHISFIENTYDTLKYPINLLKKKIEQVFGKEDKMLE
jgi:chromosome segregation ATPase